MGGCDVCNGSFGVSVLVIFRKMYFLLSDTWQVGMIIMWLFGEGKAFVEK